MKLKELTSFFSLRTISEWNTNEITKKRNILLYHHHLLKNGKVEPGVLLFFDIPKKFSKDLLHAKKFLEEKTGENFEEAYQFASYQLSQEKINALIFLTEAK